MLSKAQFEQIYEETSVNLRRYICSLIDEYSNVDDITQETYLRMLVSAPGNLSDSQYKSYLFTSATNIIRDLWRRGVIAGNWKSSDQEIEPERSDMETIDNQIDLPKVMKQMTIRQKALLWLAYAEGYSHKEIAGITGLKENSVKVLLFRARQKFIDIYHEQNSTFREKS